jgi:hypothetical protein
MPRLPFGMAPSSCFSSAESFPACFMTVRPAPFTTAIPEESYPRYSSLLSPSSNRPAAWRGPTYPTMPHILRSLAIP